MLRSILTIKRSKAFLSGLVIAAATGISPAAARDISTNAVLGKMDAKDRYPFIAGIIEGIAYHRYAAFNKDSAGMNCIYDWFYDGQKTIDVIYVALGKFPDHPPAAVIAALAKKECPE